MCTITNQLESITTVKDIECYKIVEKLVRNGIATYHSPFYYFKYVIDKLEKSNISFVKELLGYDREEEDCWFDRNYDSNKKRSNKSLKPEFKDTAKIIGEGFHSALTPIRFNGKLNRHGMSNCVIVRCIIPIGSLVYYGATDIIVSNQIIIVEEMR